MSFEVQITSCYAFSLTRAIKFHVLLACYKKVTIFKVMFFESSKAFNGELLKKVYLSGDY